MGKVDEPLGGEFGTVVIPGGHARARQVKLAGNPEGCRLLVIVEYVEFDARGRYADGHGSVGVDLVIELVNHHADDAFGRAVFVEDAHAWKGVGESARQVGGERFAAYDQVF